jgi:hypothetical protein
MSASRFRLGAVQELVLDLLAFPMTSSELAARMRKPEPQVRKKLRGLVSKGAVVEAVGPDGAPVYGRAAPRSAAAPPPSFAVSRAARRAPSAVAAAGGRAARGQRLRVVPDSLGSVEGAAYRLVAARAPEAQALGGLCAATGESVWRLDAALRRLVSEGWLSVGADGAYSCARFLRPAPRPEAVPLSVVPANTQIEGDADQGRRRESFVRAVVAVLFRPMTTAEVAGRLTLPIDKAREALESMASQGCVRRLGGDAWLAA